VCVYDIILTRDFLLEIGRIKSLLNDSFKIRDLGDLKYIIGLEVVRSKKGINLYQRKYTLNILTEIGMLDSKPLYYPSYV